MCCMRGNAECAQSECLTNITGDAMPVNAFCPMWLRDILFIVRAGNDIIKADFMHTKRTNFLTKMKISIHLEGLK